MRRKLNEKQIDIHPLKIGILLFGILLSFLGCSRMKTSMAPERSVSDVEPLTVLSYNIYFRSSLNRILAVENPVEVPAEVLKMYNNVKASDFPGRSVAIAKSIKTYQPHLIGLQEILLIRTQNPGNAITERTPDAEEVFLDSLTVLMSALQAKGLNYQVAAKVENIDAEMPMFTDAGVVDVRLTDFGVILARSDVEISRSTGGNYTNAIQIGKLGIEIPRGYTAVDATVDGVTYRFVNTHLEAFEQAIRVAQMQELVGMLSDETVPVIVLGDFNTPAPDGTAYQVLLSAGYTDLWQTDSAGTGNTCCQDNDLRNAVSNHTRRIDQIFVRNLGVPASISTYTVGDKPSDRSASGLWPSDHAGVLAQIAIE